MQTRHLPSAVLNTLLLILFNLTLISAKGGGGGGGGRGGGGGGGGGGKSFTRNTGAITGLVVGVVVILIIIIVIIFWHRSMMKEYDRMNAMHTGSGTVKPAAKPAASAGDLESQKKASVGKDSAGEKKGFRLWRWA